MPQAVARTRAAPEEDPDEFFALAMDDLVLSRLEAELPRVEARLHGEFVHRLASAEADLRLETQRELRRLHEPARARGWRPDDRWEQGDVATHGGALWQVVAARGAGGEEPSNTAACWLLIADGVEDVEIRTKDRGTSHELVVRFASGRVIDRPLNLAMPRFVGTFEPGRRYDQNSMVHRHGATWLATRSTNAGEAPADSAAWVLIAQRGKTGPAAGAAEVAKMRAELLDYIEQVGDARSAKERAADAVAEAECWLDADQRAWDKGPAAVLVEFGRRAVGGAIAGLAGPGSEAAAFDLGERVGRNVVGTGHTTMMVEPGEPGAVGKVAVAPRGLVEIDPAAWADLRDAVLEAARSAFDEPYRRRLVSRLRRSPSAKNSRHERCTRTALSVLLNEVI